MKAWLIKKLGAISLEQHCMTMISYSRKIAEYQWFIESRHPCSICGHHRYVKTDQLDTPRMNVDKYVELLKRELSRTKEPAPIEEKDAG